MHETIDAYIDAEDFEFVAAREALYAAKDAGEWSTNATLPMTLYRGTCECPGWYVEGMSWTTEREVAEWFARRTASANNCTPIVLTQTFQPEHILYVIGGGEAEVLVDTRHEDFDWMNEAAGFDAEEIEMKLESFWNVLNRREA